MRISVVTDLYLVKYKSVNQLFLEQEKVLWEINNMKKMRLEKLNKMSGTIFGIHSRACEIIQKNCRFSAFFWPICTTWLYLFLAARFRPEFQQRVEYVRR